MPTIENISVADLVQGEHRARDPGRTRLIRIVDALEDVAAWPPKERFLDVAVFRFLDVEHDDTGLTPEQFKAAAISESQARAIAGLLRDALQRGLDVVVHCTAGVARSGAVVEAAVALGFDDPQIYRAPNRFVLHTLTDALHA